MSKVTAPCGHPGEIIIGTYVRCVMGCEGAKNTVRRAQPGHVERCACKPCQVRQRTTHILLKTKDGKELKVPWDGVEEKVYWTPPWSGTLRHYKFLDEDGAVIATGFLDVPVGIGDPMYLHPQLIADKVQMSVTSDLLGYKPYTDHAPLSWYVLADPGFDKEKYDAWASALKGVGKYSLKDLSPPTKDYRTAYAEIDVPPRAGKTLRQAAKMQNFGAGSAWGYRERPRAMTAPEIQRAALSIPNVKSVRVASPWAGTVDVEILDTDCATPDDERKAADLVKAHLQEHGVAGMAYRVMLRTPMGTVVQLCKEANLAVNRVWMLDHVIPKALVVEIEKRLRGLEGYRLVSVTQDPCDKYRFEAYLMYEKGLNRRYFRVPLHY